MSKPHMWHRNPHLNLFLLEWKFVHQFEYAHFKSKFFANALLVRITHEKLFDSQSNYIFKVFYIDRCIHGLLEYSKTR